MDQKTISRNGKSDFKPVLKTESIAVWANPKHRSTC